MLQITKVFTALFNFLLHTDRRSNIGDSKTAILQYCKFFFYFFFLATGARRCYYSRHFPSHAIDTRSRPRIWGRRRGSGTDRDIEEEPEGKNAHVSHVRMHSLTWVNSSSKATKQHCFVPRHQRERRPCPCLFRSLFPVAYSHRETGPPGFLAPLLFTLRRFLFHLVAPADTAPSLNEFSSGQLTSSSRTQKGRALVVVFRERCDILTGSLRECINLYLEICANENLRNIRLIVKVHTFVTLDLQSTPFFSTQKKWRVSKIFYVLNGYM